MATPVLSLDKETADFKATLDKLQLALVAGNLDYNNAHLSLDSILKSKIDKFSSLVQKQSGFWKRTAAKAVRVSDKVLAKGAAAFILREYKKSSPSLRRYYQSNLKINSYHVKDNRAFAAGVFMGSPASLSAAKLKGQWVVVGIDSLLIDKELKRILKIK